MNRTTKPLTHRLDVVSILFSENPDEPAEQDPEDLAQDVPNVLLVYILYARFILPTIDP